MFPAHHRYASKALQGRVHTSLTARYISAAKVLQLAHDRHLRLCFRGLPAYAGKSGISGQTMQMTIEEQPTRKLRNEAEDGTRESAAECLLELWSVKRAQEEHLHPLSQPAFMEVCRATA